MRPIENLSKGEAYSVFRDWHEAKNTLIDTGKHLNSGWKIMIFISDYLEIESIHLVVGLDRPLIGLAS
jgi:hypothetical protein